MLCLIPLASANADTIAPSTPTGVSGTATSCSTITVNWSASSDSGGSGLLAYKIYRNGAFFMHTIAPSTFLNDSWLPPTMQQRYSISALDGAGNESARSAVVTVTTPACTNAPTTPSGFTATTLGCHRVRLSWNASTTSVPGRSVYAYYIYRDGVRVAYPISAPETTFIDFDDLTPGTTYRYSVSARDNQAIESPRSVEQTVTTTSQCADLIPPSAPTNLTVTPYRCTSLQLSAGPSIDTGGAGIRQYNWYRDGEFINYSNGPQTGGGGDAWIAPGLEYRFEVTAIDNDGNESPRSNAVDFTPTCLPSPNTGVKTTAVVLVTFPDQPAPPFDLNHANNLVFSGANSLNRYFQEASYNQMSLSGTSYGWYTMPNSMPSYCGYLINNLGYNCNTERLRADVFTVAQPDVDLNTFNQVIFVFNGIGTAGLGGSTYSYFSAQNGFFLASLTHELGHSFGLPHAGDWSCPVGLVGPDIFNLADGNCFASRYGDSLDPVGSGANHYSSYHKEIIGWFGPEQVQTASIDGEYLIDALAIVSGGTRELRIPLGTKGYFYFLEYRTRTGFDSNITSDGVYIRLHLGKFAASDMDTIKINTVINPGVPFLDPYRHLRVEVVSKTATQARVKITLPVSVSSNPPNGYIDPLEDRNANNENNVLGIDNVIINFSTPVTPTSGIAVNNNNFQVRCIKNGLDTPDLQTGQVPTVSSVTQTGPSSYQLQLSARICLGAWTEIKGINLVGTNGFPLLSSANRTVLGFLPMDITQNGTVGTDDAPRWLQIINEHYSPAPLTLLHFCDQKRDGALTPDDVTRATQLINGLGTRSIWPEITLGPMP